MNKFVITETRAIAWLKKFKKDIVVNESCGDVHNDLLPEQECKKQILENFKECFHHIILFLRDYVNMRQRVGAQQSDVDCAHLLQTLYSRHLITQHQRDVMLWTHVNIDYLCNTCDEQGKHIVSIQLIESYNVMHAIASHLNAK